jgi:hypothetical protein
MVAKEFERVGGVKERSSQEMQGGKKVKAESHLATRQSSEVSDPTDIYICRFDLITTTHPAVTGI